MNHVMMSAIDKYISDLWAGTAGVLWPHAILLSLSLLAGMAVGAGILLERPRFSPKVHCVAMCLVIAGVFVESICTISLFAVDERISVAQQTAAANETAAEIMKAAAWRNLTPNQRITLQKMFLAHPIAGIEMSTVHSDPEAILFCNRIMNVLNEVGAKIRHCDTVWDLAVGVRIPPFNGPERERLKEDLSAAGVDPIDDKGPSGWRGKELEIIVGSKQPP